MSGHETPEDEETLAEPREAGFGLFAGAVGTLPRRSARVAVGPEASILDAVQVMRTAGSGCVLVEDATHLVGILTERDILTKLVGTGYDPAQVRVDSLMTPRPETLRLEDPIVFALQRMSVGGFRHLPLVDNTGRVVGVLSVKDIVDHLVEHFPQAILNLPPEPGRHPSMAEGA